MQPVLINPVLERAAQLFGKLPSRTEESRQVMFTIYMLDDIKKEGGSRTFESNEMLQDIISFYDEIEAFIQNQQKGCKS